MAVRHLFYITTFLALWAACGNMGYRLEKWAGPRRSPPHDLDSGKVFGTSITLAACPSVLVFVAIAMYECYIEDKREKASRHQWSPDQVS